MNPQLSAQDVLRCHLCETPVPPLYCDLCHVNLCRSCAGNHLLDESNEHRIVPIQQRWSRFISSDYPSCSKHTNKQCELHCKQCNVSICALCVSSRDHHSHEIVDTEKHCENKKELIKKDIIELQKSILPKYQEAASDIQNHKTALNENSRTLTATFNKQGEVWHKNIDTLIKRLQSEVDDTESKSLAVLDKQEVEIKNKITEISQIILDLGKLLDSGFSSLVSEYKSRIPEYRKLPSQIKITLPNFTFETINEDQLSELFGSLSKFSMTTEERIYVTYSPEAESSGRLLDEPKIISTIDTGFMPLYNVACLQDEEIWTSGGGNIMKLYNVSGELLDSLPTTSGNWPSVLAVTQKGDLIYTDSEDQSINKLENSMIQTIVRLQDWKPLSLCSTSSDGFLVIMSSDDKQETKLVCYEGSTEKECFQWDAQGEPLYSFSEEVRMKYVSENRNLDICVADCNDCALVVITGAGKMRFRYTTNDGTFIPFGISTDSQGRILTADHYKHTIHILDADGQFLCLIDNCGLRRPWSLCVDIRDILLVAEWDTGKVKKIQYCK